MGLPDIFPVLSVCCYGDKGMKTAIRPVIPLAVNRWLLALFVGINLYQFFGLPLLLHAFGQAAPLWTLILVILSTPFQWALAHESFHGSFHPDGARNRLAGRVMCILLGAPFRILRFGHLLHHRLSRSSFDRVEAYEPGRQAWLPFAAGYYLRLCFGLYGYELISNLLAWLPRRIVRWVVRTTFRVKADDVPDTATMAERAMLDGDRLTEIRTDAVFVLMIHGVSLWLYGAYWPYLVAILIGRGLILSIQDNAPHYETPLADTHYGLNLGLPRWLSFATLHFNLHRQHHRRPNLPWRQLPALMDHQQDRTDGMWLRLMLRQFKGPVPMDRLQDLKAPD